MPSKLPAGNSAPSCRASPCTMSTVAEKPFSSTERRACQAAFSCISTPVMAPAWVRTRHSRGITPQPVPKSAQRSLGRGAAKCASSTASVPKVCWGLTSTRAPPQRGSHVVFCSRSSISRPARQKSRARRGKAPAGLCSSEIVSFRPETGISPPGERQPGKCRRKRRNRCRYRGQSHICRRPRR